MTGTAYLLWMDDEYLDGMYFFRVDPPFTYQDHDGHTGETRYLGLLRSHRSQYEIGLVPCAWA